MGKKAAPPATKLTASRLDIWPFVIREVPDSVPNKSPLRIIILPGVDSTMSDQLKSSYGFLNPPPLSSSSSSCFFLPCKYRSQNYITVLRLPPP